ncbi:carbohydrate kinase family protein, partial [Candidatus Woesearchaeota archaeon]
MYDVVTMGSATQDVFAMTDAETVTFRHGHDEQELIAYPLGSKILIHDIDFQIGGGGTNTATTFARQGLKTGFIGKIGKDPSGYAVMKFLKEEGITFLGAVGHHTGYSIILDSEEDDRTILTFKGCNDDLSLEELDTMLMELETRWLYCSSMLGKSYKTMRHVMKLLKGRGANVAFNPSCYQAEQGLEALRDVLAHV